MLEIILAIWIIAAVSTYGVDMALNKIYFSFPALLLTLIIWPYHLYKVISDYFKPKPKYENFVELISGKLFNPFHPDKHDIKIEDIAHSLSHLCRFNGHIPYFYSVAEHSVLVLDLALEDDPKMSPIKQMQYLLHDATEAYIGDMVKPLKIGMPKFNKIEDRVWKEISSKFNINYIWDEKLKYYDIKALVTEYHIFKGKTIGKYWSEGIDPKTDAKLGLTSEEAKKLFMDRFDNIRNQMSVYNIFGASS